MPRRPNKVKERREFKPVNEARLVRAQARCRCGKIFSPTEADARKAEKFQAEKHQHQNPVRFYQCRYGGWHWTRALYEVRQCRNCTGQFRPNNDQGKKELCDTCEMLLQEPSPAYTPPPAPRVDATLKPSPKNLDQRIN